VVDAAKRRGVRVEGVGVHRFSPGPPALLLGYGAMTEQGIRRGIAELAAAVEEAALDARAAR
jgi:DNA-binding transcriptional MocR family regulator